MRTWEFALCGHTADVVDVHRLRAIEHLGGFAKHLAVVRAFVKHLHIQIVSTISVSVRYETDQSQYTIKQIRLSTL